MPNHDPQAPAIELAHLTFAYEGSAPQLEDVNLTVQPGEVVVLTGPSGGGKSTLTRVVNGLVPSFYEGELTGTVRLFGREVDDIPSWERGLAAGNVFQDPRSQFFANEVAGEIAKCSDTILNSINMSQVNDSGALLNTLGRIMDKFDIEEIAADETQPAVAFVFKSQIEPHIGEISYLRVIRGKLTEGMELLNTRTGNKEKVSQLFAVAGKNRIKVTELAAGDIGCTVKLKGTRTNDTLAAPSAPVTITPIVFPEPRYRAAVQPKVKADEEKLGKLLNDAKYEDPTILVGYSKELKQTIIQGQGEHHLNILKARLAADNKMEIEYIAPRIPYRETITKVAQADYRHKKQSGGSGQFGEVHMVIEPYYEGIPEPKSYKIPGKGDITVNIKGKEEYDLPWGGKLQYYNSIVGGAIDARFMPAILKGIMEKMDEGPLTGSYARDIRVVIYDGKMHPVDSNEISFKLAARNAFKEAFRNAGPKIMEPIYSIEVLTPSEYMGAVMSDLQNRRAMIEGMNSDKGFDRLNARVPLAELYRYSTTLSSLTSGAATYTMRFSSYEQVPADVQAKLLKEYTDTDEE